MTIIIAMLVFIGILFPPTKTASAQPDKAPLLLSYQAIDRLTKANAIQHTINTTTSVAELHDIRQPKRISKGTLPSGRNYSREEVIQLIKDYSALYGINSDLPLRIAKCESGYNHLAKNKTSSASGTFQYLSSTWAGTDEGRAGLSVFDAGANVRAAIKYIASRGHAQPWAASKGCWNA